MDLDTARGLVAHAPQEISDLRRRLAEFHAAHPQRAALADLALHGIEQELQKLAALGHQFFLTEQAPAEHPEFPAMIYRDTPTGLENRTVETKEELQALLEQGWREHPSLQSPVTAPASLDEKLAGQAEGPAGGEPGAIIGDPGMEPPRPAGPPGAAGAESDSKGDDLVSHTDDAQREQLAEADASVEHHDEHEHEGEHA